MSTHAKTAPLRIERVCMDILPRIPVAAFDDPFMVPTVCPKRVEVAVPRWAQTLDSALTAINKARNHVYGVTGHRPTACPWWFRLTEVDQRAPSPSRSSRRRRGSRRWCASRSPAPSRLTPGGAFKGFLTVGLYDDGSVGEVFMKLDQQGSQICGFCDAWAIAVSMLLQTGTPLEAICQKFKHMKFEPSGRTKTPGIRTAESPIDYAARYLERRFVLRLPLEDA